MALSLKYGSVNRWASLIAQLGKNLPAMQETLGWFLGLEDHWRRDGLTTPVFLGFPCGSAGKESAQQCGRPGFDPWVKKIPWRRERLPTPAFWPGAFHGLYSPRGHEGSHTTEQLSLSLSPWNPDSTVGFLFSSQLFKTFQNTIHFIYMLFF